MGRAAKEREGVVGGSVLASVENPTWGSGSWH